MRRRRYQVTRLDGVPIRRGLLRWHPGGEQVTVCLSSNRSYICKGCRRRCCNCNGAADEMPLHCDDCWAEEHS